MTWIPIPAGSLPERDAVFGLKEEPYRLLKDMLVLAWQITDPELLDLCRLRLAQIMGTRAELAGMSTQPLADLGRWDSGPRFSQRERAALAFAEQYHYDHNRIEAERAELARFLSEQEVFNFIWALHMNDAYLRALTLLDIAPDPAAAPARPERTPPTGGPSALVPLDPTETNLLRLNAGPAFDEAYSAFSSSVARQSLINDVTSESIRLRNARHQGCQFCMSIRRKVEKPPQESDLMDEVMNFEQSTFFNDAQKAAFRLHGAFLAHPAGFGPEGRADVLTHLSPPEIAELALKYIYWSTNKPYVLMGMDGGAVDEEHLTAFEYDAEGQFVLHALTA